MASNEWEAAARDIADAWARTLRGIRDVQLQVGQVRAQLARLGVMRAADVLSIVLARAEQHEDLSSVLLLRISLALAAPELAALKRATARVAEARGQLALARFLGAQPADGDPAHDGPEGEEPDAEREREPEPSAARETERGRPLSLGERKSLARRRDRNLLARVLRDPHPDVVRILLDNPALTELDVVRLCARRPISPAALSEVFRHPRWICRYRVRRTLALNPYTPEELALQILPHLTSADLKAVACSGALSERVRAACSLPHPRALH